MRADCASLFPAPLSEVEILKCGDRSVCFGDWRAWGVSDPMQLTKARTAQGKSDRTFPLALLRTFIAWVPAPEYVHQTRPGSLLKEGSLEKGGMGLCRGPSLRM